MLSTACKSPSTIVSATEAPENWAEFTSHSLLLDVDFSGSKFNRLHSWTPWSRPCVVSDHERPALGASVSFRPTAVSPVPFVLGSAICTDTPLARRHVQEQAVSAVVGDTTPEEHVGGAQPANGSPEVRATGQPGQGLNLGPQVPEAALYPAGRIKTDSCLMSVGAETTRAACSRLQGAPAFDENSQAGKSATTSATSVDAQLPLQLGTLHRRPSTNFRPDARPDRRFDGCVCCPWPGSNYWEERRLSGWVRTGWVTTHQPTPTLTLSTHTHNHHHDHPPPTLPQPPPHTRSHTQTHTRTCTQAPSPSPNTPARTHTDTHTHKHTLTFHHRHQTHQRHSPTTLTTCTDNHHHNAKYEQFSGPQQAIFEGDFGKCVLDVYTSHSPCALLAINGCETEFDRLR